MYKKFSCWNGNLLFVFSRRCKINQRKVVVVIWQNVDWAWVSTYIITSILQWDNSSVSKNGSGKLWLRICLIGFPKYSKCIDVMLSKLSSLSFILTGIQYPLIKFRFWSNPFKVDLICITLILKCTENTILSLD